MDNYADNLSKIKELAGQIDDNFINMDNFEAEA
jgi:hypothetical protein